MPRREELEQQPQAPQFHGPRFSQAVGWTDGLTPLTALMLHAVVTAIPDGRPPAPALEALIAAGLVEEQSGQSLRHHRERPRRVLELQD